MALPGPTPAAERALGPDLARGFMLLFIALANTHYFLTAPQLRGGYPLGEDPVVVWLISTFVDGRAFPMFGLLFGYGVAQIARRQQERGEEGVRKLLRRRSAVLIVVGLVDALLFFVGDILAAYGVLLFVGLWMVRWKDRRLLTLAAVFLVITALPGADATTISAAGPDPAMLPPDLAAVVTHRLPAALVIALLGPIGFLCPFAIGLWCGRRTLSRPALTKVAIGGLGVAVLGAQPIALWLAGVTTSTGTEPAAALHSVTGTLGGLGYAALFALVTGRNRLTIAIAATGRRSMTCYLMQSVTWAIVFTPALLDLSGTLTVAGTAVLATATWLVTVGVAEWMRRAGRRGPFETLIRRISYGPGRPATRATP